MRRLVVSTDVAYVLYSVLPHHWLFGLARLHGTLTYLIRRRERETVRRNLDRIFGAMKTQAELNELTRKFFQHRRARGVLLAIAPRLTPSELTTLFPLDGLEHVDAALERQRGVILLGSHLNSLTMFNALIALRQRGYDVGAALPEPKDPWAPSLAGEALARLFRTKRLFELTGAFYAQFNIRPIVRRLAENRIVAQTGDGFHSARFVDVEFLGRQVPFPTGMASIAQMTGAAVVPMFQVGAPPDNLRIVFEPPQTVERGSDEERLLRDAVAAFAERLEHHLRQNIACWEHWLIEDTLATMAAWREKPLKERYKV